MDLVAAVVADEEPLELMQPGEGALDDPADAAERGAVLGLAACDRRRDSAPAELAPVLVVVIPPISGDALRPAARPADLAAHRRHALHQRHELGYVVAVAAGDRPGERDAGGVDQEVMLGAASGSVNRARPRRGAPFFACTWLESTTARSHSSAPAARSSANSSGCSRSHTPACCQATMRR
jgi:hypothetical protein